MAKEEDKETGPVGQTLNPENLALLRKGDRLVILAVGLIVIAVLGALAALRDDPIVALVLALISIVTVAVLVGSVQWRSRSLGSLEADLQVQAAAGQTANGEWWQLVPAKDHPGLTCVSVAISAVAERQATHGTTFDASCRLAKDPSCLGELANDSFGRFELEPGRSLSDGLG